MRLKVVITWEDGVCAIVVQRARLEVTPQCSHFDQLLIGTPAAALSFSIPRKHECEIRHFKLQNNCQVEDN